MQKPAPNAPAIEHLAYGMCQIADERKEACIHCGNVWYAIHHKDGVCHACQKKGLRGRTEMARRSASLRRIVLTAVVAIVATIVMRLIFF